MIAIKPEAFETSLHGKTVSLFTLKNSQGLVAQITNFGAILVGLFVPDREGAVDDVVLGFDSIDQYLRGNGPYFGAICGRVANRITRGQFVLDGKSHSLAINNGPNHLHGGLVGYDKVVWDLVSVSNNRLELGYLSQDNEEGYPGTARIGVVYSLNDRNELCIDYHATTGSPTIINLTSHSYFDLSGQGNNRGTDHELKINANYFMPITPTWEPTGEIVTVKNTPMDFTDFKKIGRDLHKSDLQLQNASGYDHNYVLNKVSGDLGLAATLYEPGSGRLMEIFTSQPGIQFYSGNYLDGLAGKGGKSNQKQGALCLETQGFPDAVNNPHFPSTVLRPGSTYHERCIHRFSVRPKVT